MYHDASEVLTGDLPTPVKYFNSQIAQEYKAIEKSPSKSWLIWRRMNYAIFSHRLLMRMPERRRTGNRKTGRCALRLPEMPEELSAGNNEFGLAKRGWKNAGITSQPEMDYFMAVFVPSFHLSLDEISQIHRFSCRMAANALSGLPFFP